MLIEKFFEAFKKLDANAMNACYADDIGFYDPMFDLLKGEQVKAMWQMLCKNASNFSLTYTHITDLGDGYYTCNWEATYLYSITKRKVVNTAKAFFKIENEQIQEHSDAWSLHKWSGQALGYSGKLLGWMGLFRNRIKNTAKKKLLQYIQTNQQYKS